MSREIVHDVIQGLIGILLLAAAFWFLYSIYLSPTPAQESESLFQVVGGVLTLIGTVVGFYFGTSLSSSRKDSTIAKAVPKLPPDDPGA